MAVPTRSRLILPLAVLALLLIGAGLAAGFSLLRSTSGATVTASSSPAPIPGGGGAQGGVAAQIESGGAGTCASQVNAMAKDALSGVVKAGSLSKWAVGDDKSGRMVSGVLGQSFAKGVPYGVAGFVAAPSGHPACDGLWFEVVPSQIPCAKLRETMAGKGDTATDLAGVQVMTGKTGAQTALVPTAAGACVIVGINARYAN